MNTKVESHASDGQRGFGHLPVELFKTERSGWVFEANKVEFIKVDQVAFNVIDWLRRGKLTVDAIALSLPEYSREQINEVLADIVSAQQQGYFLPAGFRRALRFKSEDCRPVLQDRMEGLTLSLTTRCNLSCSYCIFGGAYSRYPAQSDRTMTWTVLKNALDFLLEHSRQSKRIHVLFFGGEPLIAFTLIRRAVAYLREELTGDPRLLRISICTNGTILSEAILSFLVENKVTLQISLDGDREIHDKNRRFKSAGAGSFDTILRNLTTLEQRHPEYFREFVHIKGVIESADGRSQGEIFQDYPIRELDAQRKVSFLLLEPHYDVALDGDYFRQLQQIGEMLLEREGVSTLDELLQDFSSNQEQYFWQSYGWFFAAQAIERLGQRGARELPFSKGCMLGASEGHVGPDGNISICHKAQQGDAFVIGNVNDGVWDFAKIDELNQWLHGCDECSSCFAQRFCSLCFEKLKGEREALDEGRARYCEFMRHSLRLIFRGMLEVMDRNPLLWAEVDRYIDRRIANERARLKECAELPNSAQPQNVMPAAEASPTRSES